MSCYHCGRQHQKMSFKPQPQLLPSAPHKSSAATSPHTSWQAQILIKHVANPGQNSLPAGQENTTHSVPRHHDCSSLHRPRFPIKLLHRQDSSCPQKPILLSTDVLRLQLSEFEALPKKLENGSWIVARLTATTSRREHRCAGCSACLGISALAIRLQKAAPLRSASL